MESATIKLRFPFSYFTVRSRAVLDDGFVASELLSVNAFTVTV
jgi:hypothetical protein